MSKIGTGAFLAAAVMFTMSFGRAAAQQVYGPFSDCHGAIGGTIGSIAFPAAGTGGTAPTTYLLIQNNSTSNQNIWINVLPGGVATTAPPSIQLAPTASVVFQSTTSPVPTTVSIIATASSAVYSCIYK